MNTRTENVSQTQTSQRKYSFEAAYGSSDDTKEEACACDDGGSISKSIDKLQDDEMESLLDEIEFGYTLEQTANANTKEDDLIAFGVNDEAIEEEETMIEDILDEIEKQEEKKENSNDKLWAYSRLVKDMMMDGNINININRSNTNTNAFKLRLHKQRTFANFLEMERIITEYTIKLGGAPQKEECDIFVNDTDLFYCPSEMDYLLHGFIRNIMRQSIATIHCNDDRLLLCHMVPQVVIRLVHAYYLCGNNRYYGAMKECGIHWNEHRVIVQHQRCHLWRWDESNLNANAKWVRCNGDGMGQSTLLYDEVKGFTRFVHFDSDTNKMRCLQIIEANEKIHAANITHDDAQHVSAFVLAGFDFNNQNNNNKYGTIQRFKMEMVGPNHRYYCKQFVKCYNNIVQSEIKNEMKMLKKKSLFSTAATATPNIEHLHEYVAGLHARDDEAKHIKYSRLIRRLLSNECSPPIQEIIDCGIIQRLIYLMQYSSSYVVKFECAWSLTNIASGNRQHTATLIRFNAIHALLNVFRHKTSIVEIKEQCLWALGNIAGDSVACRDQVLSHDILKYLLPAIRPYRMLMFKQHVQTTADAKDKDSDINNKEVCQRQKTFMRNLVWTLSNLNRNKPLPAPHHIILSLHAINIILKDAMCVADSELMQDCCWTLSYLSDYCEDDTGDDHNIRLDLASILLDSGLIDILIGLLSDAHTSDRIKHPALRTIGNIATGNDYLTNKLLNKKGILDAIAQLLKNEMSAIKRETLWLISNITAGDAQQIELILKHDKLLFCIMNILNADNEENSVKREAVWAISNATSGGSDAQIRYICDNNGIYALSHYVNECVHKQYYGKVFNVCCQGLQNMLHVGAHDALLTHHNPLQAVLGRNGTQNVYALFVERFGATQSLENALNDEKCPDETKERCLSILDAYFPFRHLN